jgi:multicomponent Na+:H+ antiporter subunit D
MPTTCFAFLLAILAMIGLPPGAGFVTKWYLILAVLDAKKYVFIVFIFVSTLLMIVYFWRVVEIIYVRPAPAEHQAVVAMQETPLSMRVPTLILGILTFAVGILWMSGLFSPILEAINVNFGLGKL